MEGKKRRRRMKKRRKRGQVVFIDDLPNLVKHHIFKFLDLKSALRLGSVSKQWSSLWYTTPYLDFDSHSPLLMDPRSPARGVNSILSHRPADCEIKILKINLVDFSNIEVENLVRHAISCNILDLQMKAAAIEIADQILPRLENLKLTHCLVPLMSWDLPKLTSLYLHDITLPSNLTPLIFNCLEELTLVSTSIAYFPGPLESLVITTPKLSKLSLWITAYHTCNLDLSAPELSTFRYSGHELFLRGAFPSIKDVILYITSFKIESVLDTLGELILANEDGNSFLQMLINLFNVFCQTEFLNLSILPIEVLSRLQTPDVSPFYHLKSVTLNGNSPFSTLHKQAISLPMSLVDRAIGYLISNSPNANVVIKDKEGYFTSPP